MTACPYGRPDCRGDCHECRPESEHGCPWPDVPAEDVPRAECRHCQSGIYWQACAEHGGWWVHDVHPADDHDASPACQAVEAFHNPDALPGCLREASLRLVALVPRRVDGLPICEACWALFASRRAFETIPLTRPRHFGLPQATGS